MNSNSQEKKIESTLRDLIDTVERFYGAVPMEFLEADGGSDFSYFTFPKHYRTEMHFFDPFHQHLLETLDPIYLDAAQRAEAAEKIINAALPPNDELKRAWCAFHDATTDQLLPAQRLGFILGVLVGAKFAGATRADLVRIVEGIKIPCLYRWGLMRAKQKKGGRRG